MHNNESLKKRLTVISENDWKIPEDTDVYKLALEAMESIGSIDPVLRDDLILTYLWTVITEGRLSKPQLREILGICLSKAHLFCMPLDKESDAVFNRAFTVLVVRCIIYCHYKYGQDLLSEAELQETFNSVIRYARLEKDVRGYVEDKGWGHSTAHLADTLRIFALCSGIKHNQLMELLELVKEKMNTTSYVYINEEAERLVSVVINVISRGELSESELLDWIAGFGEIAAPGSFPETHYWRENIKNLLRSLYFRLKFKNAPLVYLEQIEKVLNGVSETFNNMSE